MKYTKCPICEEKLRNGICPMCGYDFTRLKQQNQMEKDHWDVLTRDQKTKVPVFAHDEKKHPSESKKKQKKKNNVYKQEKKKNRKISKIFIFILIAIIYLLSFLSEAAPEIFEHIKQMINHIYI